MSSDDQNNQQQQQPSLVSGHAEYDTIGSVTGSHAWQTSGQQAKAHATQEMKMAGEERQGAGAGKVEEMAGKAVGCEGMEKEGAATRK
ncbi:hypothetical protein BDY21DRAFT_368944 [Lineolata rhizophorae]|uniref:CsbD-like domain-containing protein n=1 Tax=Lineolata rhizophorae TaxID=578093 RepID=A0A6A6PA94_9PEZI|nr:hypothetical protein BDY21DRAFT_368944 [Lineolata rhizophorae]